MSSRPLRVVATAFVPMRVLHLDVPPTVSYDRRAEVESRLVAGGFEVFTFSPDDLGAFVRGDGWQGWLRQRGYCPESAEAVFFDYEPGWGDRPAMLLGALRPAPRRSQ